MFDVAMSDSALSSPAAPLATSLTHPPFSGGRVVADTLRTSGRNAVPFGLAAIAFFSPAILFDLFAGDREEVARLSTMLWTLLGCFTTAAVVRGTLDALDGRRARTAGLLRAGAATGLRVLGVSILVSLLTLLGLVLLVIPGFVASAGLYVAAAAVVAEPALPAREGIARSWSLTRGHRWAMLGIGALFLVIPLGLSMVAEAIALLVEGNAAAPAVMALGNVVLAVALCLPAAAAAAAYRDLRAEKEGVAASDLGAVFE
jgi:hypothetical protein